MQDYSLPIQDYSRMFSSLALNDSGCGASTTSPGRLFHRLIVFAVRKIFLIRSLRFTLFHCILVFLVITVLPYPGNLSSCVVFMTFKYFEMASKSTLGWILSSIIQYGCHTQYMCSINYMIILKTYSYFCHRAVRPCNEEHILHLLVNPNLPPAVWQQLFPKWLRSTYSLENAWS